jgi:glycosyltransferase involved in cell wall biosynthesis
MADDSPQRSPLVSVVTPSLNQCSFIEETIRSVAEQDYARIEHIVVDGASTDGTVEVLQRYPHLRWLSEPDDGQSAAIRKGFNLAQGEIFGWLNSDDYYLDGSVAIAVEALVASGCGLVYGDVTRINDNGINPRRIKTPAHLDRWWEINVHNSLCQPAVFFTRKAYEEAGGIAADLHYAMDYDLWLRIAERFDVLHLDVELAVQRISDKAKTVAHRKEFYHEDRAISRRNGGRLLSPMFATRLAMGSRRLDRGLNRLFAAGYMVAEGRFSDLVSRLSSTVS